MGAEPWFYFVPFEADLQAALEKLKAQEFAAGRFFPSDEKPANIEEARELAAETGTQSILDMDVIADDPYFGVVTPLPEDILEEYFGTPHPTHDQLAQCEELFEEIDRGQGVCAIVYKNGKPDEIFFAGYSYD